MIEMCAQTKTRSSTLVVPPPPNGSATRFEIGDQPCRPLVQPEGDPRRVPEHERRHDAGDQRENQIGLAEVTPFETCRALRLADQEGADHAGQDENDEQIDEEREPALAA